MDKTTSNSITTQRAWYSATIAEFLDSPLELVQHQLASNNQFPLISSQREAWKQQINILRDCLVGLEGSVFLEFSIPRMGRRIDVVLLIKQLVFVLEFKVGEIDYDRSSLDQVWDYALDLKNFHQGSHNAAIVPILVSTEATIHYPTILQADADDVYRPLPVNTHGIRSAMDAALKTVTGMPIDHQQWANAPYHPTPTIIEAARSLYSQHSVEAIARHDAEAKNLGITSRRIEGLVDEAKANSSKIICFVTGVPGAGKTLVGLNIATRRSGENQPTHATFLSGNGPLVAVLREALTRDEVSRQKQQTKKVRKGDVARKVKAFIQNVHHFRDEAIIDDTRHPNDHVVIFDEAQRAWNAKQTASFMLRKKNVPDFNQSEPEFLISYMDRHQDWAVIICLVGGGQEINTGEAGISAWIDAVCDRFPHWQMFISPKLTDAEYAAGHALDRVRHLANHHFDDRLHLSVSMRSFRAENLSAFVKALLDREQQQAQHLFREIGSRYPLVLTRNLSVAKQWIRTKARGTERFGLVASSKAQRLKPHAIDIRVDVDPIHWFLNDRDDTRSSYYLEDAATEFQVQGLELDWVCVTWDGDLRYSDSGWAFHDFRGNRWCNIKNAENRSYMLNAYRVLLTRARQGMVLVVPPGDGSDPTRSSACYDHTFNYLKGLGIPEIEQ